MRPSSKLSIASVLVIALGISMAALRERPEIEPESGGIALSGWLHQLSYGAPGEAGAAFREMGASAVPVLLQKLRENKRSPVHAAYGAIHAKLPVALRKHCPAPKYRDPALPGQIAIALSHAAPGSVSQLLAAMKDPNPDVRTAVVHAIRMIQPGEPEALVALAAAEEDSDERVRAGARLALQAIQAGRKHE